MLLQFQNVSQFAYGNLRLNYGLVKGLYQMLLNKHETERNEFGTAYTQAVCVNEHDAFIHFAKSPLFTDALFAYLLR